MKSSLIKPYAAFIKRCVLRDSKMALLHQKKLLPHLIKTAANTLFGKDHRFKSIKNIKDYQANVPVRTYEEIKSYIEKIKQGERDVLWPKKPKYLAKTSGTTSGAKYIPISDASIKQHINAAKNTTLNYTANINDQTVFDGNVIFLSGSPILTNANGVSTGRLSGIVNHEIPFWIKKNQLPTYQTNCIEDWEEKVDAIIEETKNKDLRLISGIPPWVQMYFERLLEVTQKNSVLEVFPNFSLFVFGGVNFEPYRSSLEKLIGGHVNSLETYPASEGFIAFQDQLDNKGLLLNTNAGMFFEFIPLHEIQSDSPTRLTLEQVEKDIDYVIIISSNAGLWAYNLGDTIRFVSCDPYRIIVTGRVKHFISAFGEHVISKEVDEAIKLVCDKLNLEVIEFTVAPQVNPVKGKLPYHEWLIEFESPPISLSQIEELLDEEMIRQNIYYRDLVEGNILRPLRITALRRGAFKNYMRDIGKLGGQNKVPRLSNDRKIADVLTKYI